MKTSSKNSAKFSEKWQEFVEYLESIYWPNALETMTNEAVAFEYQVFMEMAS